MIQTSGPSTGRNGDETSETQAPVRKPQKFEPRPDTASGRDPRPSDTGGPVAAGTFSGRSLLLRLSERFGMDGNKSEADRNAEFSYRSDRLAEMEAEFPRILAAGGGFEASIREIHRVLNRNKRFRNFHRLMKLLFPNGYAAGAYRKTPQRGADYLAPRAVDVPPLMAAFGRRLDELLSQPLDDVHTRLVCGWALTMMIRIHPFADGNGRTARTLINLLLARGGHRTIDFPTASEVYRRSPVWSAFKDYMRTVRDELGWSLRSGSVPPAGYYDNARSLLERDIAAASIAWLDKQTEIIAISDALDRVRYEGFETYRRA